MFSKFKAIHEFTSTLEHDHSEELILHLESQISYISGYSPDDDSWYDTPLESLIGGDLQLWHTPAPKEEDIISDYVKHELDHWTVIWLITNNSGGPVQVFYKE